MTKEKPSRMYIHGMRRFRMEQICEETFGEYFLSVEVKLPDRIFVVRIADDADIRKMQKFTEKYKLCLIELIPRMSYIIYRGQKQLAPANKK